jgi:hypothetical protein
VFLYSNDLGIRDLTLPNNGWYQFIAEDLGQKMLSKGLEIKKSGEFTIAAENYNSTIKGSLKVRVTNNSENEGTKNITILYPQANSTVSQGNIMMSAISLELPSSPAQIYLNDILVNEIPSDAGGNINASLQGLRQGNNTLEIVITSLGGEELGRSEKITFAYTPLGSNLFKSIKAIPNTGILLGDLVTFEVTTDTLVSSAVIIFNNGERLPTDKVSDGKFSRSTVMITTGEQILSVEVTALGETQLSSGVLTLFIDQETVIENVTFKLDPQTMKDLDMSWSVSGKPASLFEVKYGTEKETLDKTIEVDRTEIIFTNIDTTKQRFFQITPLYGTEKTHGAASDIYDWIGPGPVAPPTSQNTGNSQPSSPVVVDFPENTSLCSVKGIRVTTQKVGGKYYLVW